MIAKTRATASKTPMTNPILTSFLGSLRQIDDCEDQCYNNKYAYYESHFRLLLCFF